VVFVDLEDFVGGQLLVVGQENVGSVLVGVIIGNTTQLYLLAIGGNACLFVFLDSRIDQVG